ncbi:hypothetical protein DSL72_001523 [Monilinia vaccinii-corymbosi]|uniref:Uncharacterized protein n=1 Tax=Monilinia vaccinii-corymbosi TaxID=61207 RepID=A0A8A3P633_9HELO|nr:hypothetical protein DSL72_001523 [Monilinia vaccinii-corymbosi]
MSTRLSALNQPDSAEAFAAAMANNTFAWYSFLISLANYLQKTEKQTDAFSTDFQLKKSISVCKVKRCYNFVSCFLQKSCDSFIPILVPVINSLFTDSATSTKSAKTVLSFTISIKP